MNQRLSSWDAKCARISSTFRAAISSVRWHERIGRADVPVVLRDLVLEDQVVAERVPRQLGDEAMVLVQIGALVREDQVG